MTTQQETRTKNNFLKNDRKLTCSLLTFYGLCIICFFTGGSWLFNETNKRMTATAAARETEQAQYEFIDHFNSNDSYWRIGPQIDRYYEGEIRVEEGVYVWKVNKVKSGFVRSSAFRRYALFKDFDIYVDIKFVEATPAGICGGLHFRRSSQGVNHGTYVFIICNDATFMVRYFDEQGWEDISNRQFHNAIRRSDWNRIEISARGNQFSFTINNDIVHEMTDDRLREGGLGMVIDVIDKNPAVIWFDNFGYQSR